MDTNSMVYQKHVSGFINDKNASILVCGAQISDRNALFSAGYRNVLLSGMDERKQEYHPFEWVKENAMELSFPDESFDYVIIHAALHHMSNPHKAVTEMYRVARKGLICFEGRDSFLIRVAAKLGLTQKYEVAGAYPTCGVDGTDIPNYIFRWTEREFEKTIKAYKPGFRHKFVYKYWSLYPDGPDLSKPRKFIMKLLRPFFYLFVALFPKQQNGFIFYVAKPSIESDLHPWLYLNKKTNKIEVNYNWISTNYKKLKNRKT